MRAAVLFRFPTCFANNAPVPPYEKDIFFFAKIFPNWIKVVLVGSIFLLFQLALVRVGGPSKRQWGEGGRLSTFTIGCGIAPGRDRLE